MDCTSCKDHEHVNIFNSEHTRCSRDGCKCDTPLALPSDIISRNHGKFLQRTILPKSFTYDDSFWNMKRLQYIEQFLDDYMGPVKVKE